MKTQKSENTIAIIGAGFAGLAAGIYAQMNGFTTKIFEMHTIPGGLCTSWKRKGFTIDGCIHWLVGSSPKSMMYKMWEEVGLAQNTTFINHDEYMRFEGEDERTLILYTDIRKLEKHLLSFSPQDAVPIRKLIKGIRMCTVFQPPSHRYALIRFFQGLWIIGSFMFHARGLRRWLKCSAAQFAEEFKDPILKKAITDIWFPDFSMFFMLFTFALLHQKNAGYPIGGSMPLSRSLAKRYTDLGGTIHYAAKVEKIITDGNTATGILLANGTTHHASRIISAADGYATLYKMLEGKYGDEKTHQPYKEWATFPALLYMGFGVKRNFDQEPTTVSGTSIELSEPVIIGNVTHDTLWFHVFNHDPTMAPKGKTTVVVMMKGDYAYWKDLSIHPEVYNQEKNKAAELVIHLLAKRFPDIQEDIEMIDVATPTTFERYTGNWKGSFEGWLLTPKNYKVLFNPMPKTIDGLNRFYMCGQWVEPGGGLPTAIRSGKSLIRKICRETGRKFIAERAPL